MLPTTSDVLAFLGRSGSGVAAETLESHIATITAMVKAYTRGGGFDGSGYPEADVAAVIISSVARQISNPTHSGTVSIDDASVRLGLFNGWTLPELAVLHRYRKRAL